MKWFEIDEIKMSFNIVVYFHGIPVEKIAVCPHISYPRAFQMHNSGIINCNCIC